jgi:UDP-glucose:glycoprotein glucosyltransferase
MYIGKLVDPEESLDVSVYFYDLPTTVKRRNPFIYPSNQPGSLRVINLPEIFERAGIPRSTLDYVYPREFRCLACFTFTIFMHIFGAGTVESIPLTIWVLGDLNDPAHVDLLREAVIAMVRSFS